MAPSYVVVDGSNIATEGRSTPSLAQLDEAVRQFQAEFPGTEVIVVVDATFGHRIDPSERTAFDEAVAHGELVSPPAGAVGRGDAFLLRVAERVGAQVLSNDSFQEFHAEHPWLFDEGRLIGGKPVPGVGWIFTPRSPVRGARSRAVVGGRPLRQACGAPRRHGSRRRGRHPTSHRREQSSSAVRSGCRRRWRLRREKPAKTSKGRQRRKGGQGCRRGRGTRARQAREGAQDRQGGEVRHGAEDHQGGGESRQGRESGQGDESGEGRQAREGWKAEKAVRAATKAAKPDNAATTAPPTKARRPPGDRRRSTFTAGGQASPTEARRRRTFFGRRDRLARESSSTTWTTSNGTDVRAAIDVATVEATTTDADADADTATPEPRSRARRRAGAVPPRRRSTTP